MNLVKYLIFSAIIISFVRALPSTTASDDEITELPGIWPQPIFKQYSGYLQASATRFLHYWLVESQSAPQNDPLVLWFNGGPGCSSMDGFLSEHGPFLVIDNASLKYNPLAWNMRANVLYIEAPAGVGFSYDTTNKVVSNDVQVADENYQALMHFFRKFPQYLKNDFYISGESYAGVYVPTLTVRVMANASIPLKGMLVGNGLSSYDLNSNSLLYFGHFHGLFGDKLWDDLLSNCCPNKNLTEVCPFTKGGGTVSKCNKLVLDAANILNYGLNVYNLYGPCFGGVNEGPSSKKYHYLDLGNLFITNKYVHQQRKLRSHRQVEAKLPLSIPCTNITAITTYLNQADVRRALHIDPTVGHWDICSFEVNQYYERTYSDMSEIYTQIIASKKVRILVYNGDVDMACNFLGDEWFLDQLNLKIVDPRRHWLFTDADYTQQIAGYTKSWLGNVTFATIRGAGHMVPTDAPRQALAMFQRFLASQSL